MDIKFKIKNPDRLLGLKKDVGAKNMLDLFNRSIKLFSIIVEEVKKGREIVSFDKKANKYSVIDIPMEKELRIGSDLFD